MLKERGLNGRKIFRDNLDDPLGKLRVYLVEILERFVFSGVRWLIVSGCAGNMEYFVFG